MSTCTDFCGKVRSLSAVIRGGHLPIYQELLRHLFSSTEPTDGTYGDEHASDLGTWADVLRRSTSCKFCRLVVGAVTDHTSQPPNPEQMIRVILFPDEQSLRLSYPSRLGTRLAFIAPDNGISTPNPEAARLISNFQPIRPSLITHWLTTCETHHHSTCSNPSTPQAICPESPHPFRLIDLHHQCIRPSALTSRYISLSYVWGQLPMFRLLSSNLAALSQPGSLPSVSLPRTITDAMALAQALGEHFLWVDALCLVQDDEEDVRRGVEQMSEVYTGSLFTIVAGSGEDAGAGLPGVGEEWQREPEQMVVHVGGLQMAVLRSIDWYLMRSVYNRRGWTLQELVLPRRALIFIGGRAFWRCQWANWAEDSTADAAAGTIDVDGTHSLDADDFNISRIPDVDEGPVTSFWAYQKLCEEYTRRSLRFPGDALRAASGILRCLAKGMGETAMVEGMPAKMLDMAMLWISSRGDLRRREGFASYSWAGWEGRVMWPRENYFWYDETGRRSWDSDNLVFWLKHHTFVSWHAASWRSGNVERFEKEFEPDPKASIGYLLESIWDLPPTENQTPEARKRDRASWLLTGLFFGEVQSQSRFDRAFLSIENELQRTLLSNRIINSRFWTRRERSRPKPSSRRGYDRNHRSDDEDWELEHSEFRNDAVRSTETEDKYRVLQELMYESERMTERLGNQMSEISVATPLKLPMPSSRPIITAPVVSSQRRLLTEGRMMPRYPLLFFATVSIQLVLGTSHPLDDRGSSSDSAVERTPGIPLLSASEELVGSLHPDRLHAEPEAYTPGSRLELLLLSRSHTPTTFSALLPKLSDNTEQGPWDLFWAMHVNWRDDGLAERRGIAQVFATAVKTAGPVVKSVVLA